MKIALIGSTGMLGSKVAEVYKAKGYELLTPSRAELNLNYPHTIDRFFKANSFEAVINCGGFTRVDACEEPAKFSTALTVNGTSAGWLAKFCKKANRLLIHFSTDYVFDGEKEGLYQETDNPNPINVYGKTKWQGEKLIQTENPPHYLVRTSWVFGPYGVNFVKTIAGLLKTKPKIEVVTDQIGGPTYTGDLAEFTLELLEKKCPSGLYHFANEGYTSWNGFACEIQKIMGSSSCHIAGVLSKDVFRPAQRPANSRFDLSKAAQAVGHISRPWQEALNEYLTKEFKSETV